MCFGTLTTQLSRWVRWWRWWAFLLISLWLDKPPREIFNHVGIGMINEWVDLRYPRGGTHPDPSCSNPTSCLLLSNVSSMCAILIHSFLLGQGQRISNSPLSQISTYLNDDLSRLPLQFTCESFFCSPGGLNTRRRWRTALIVGPNLTWPSSHSCPFLKFAVASRRRLCC